MRGVKMLTGYFLESSIKLLIKQSFLLLYKNENTRSTGN